MSKNKKVLVKELIEKLGLGIVAGQEKLDNEIKEEDFFRPGLQLNGFFDEFSKDKIQIIGKQEGNYLISLTVQKRREAIKKYVETRPPCIIITRNQEISEEFNYFCQKNKVPLLKTEMSTFELTSKLVNFLEKSLSKEMGVHGVCVNVFGVGILLRGESGVGKSEVALSLIERGHRLISDDLVLLKKIGPEALIGMHNGVNKDFLALRGIGLVNIHKLYGTGALQSETKINLDLLLEPWTEGKYYDAVYQQTKSVDYMGIKIEHIEIPIKPGRDIASLIEVAAKNWRLKQDGYKAVDEFEERVKNLHKKNQ